MRRSIATALLALSAVTATAASAEVRITEFMYQSGDRGAREFFELTNIGSSAVNVAGWTYNDNNPNDPVAFGDFFGSIGANESVILTELTPAAFRSFWGLADSVRVFSIGGSSNLGSDDTINIYSSSVQTAANLVDTVTYDGVTRGISRNRPLGVDGTVTNAGFVNSALGDVYGSVQSVGGTSPADIGNPGRFDPNTGAVPEPAAWAMMIGGFGLVGGAARRRRSAAFA